MAVKLENIKYIAMKLANDGQRLIERAFLQADFKKDKTQNLHDSYGSAVFYDGKLFPGTKRYFSKMATKPRYNSSTQSNEYGRDEINKFFDTYRPSDDSMQLVVVVAMFYGGILESGVGLKRKYKVIFMVGDDLKALAAKIKGSSVMKIERGRVSSL